jgi:hypothetical protein
MIAARVRLGAAPGKAAEADRYRALARALGATANLPTSDRPG